MVMVIFMVSLVWFELCRHLYYFNAVTLVVQFVLIMIGSYSTYPR